MAEKRESPTYLALGVDKEMLVRLDKPIKQEAEKAYKEIYGALPTPGLGKFLGFAVSLGLEQIQKLYLSGGKKKPARTAKTVRRPQP